MTIWTKFTYKGIINYFVSWLTCLAEAQLPWLSHRPCAETRQWLAVTTSDVTAAVRPGRPPAIATKKGLLSAKINVNESFRPSFTRTTKTLNTVEATITIPIFSFSLSIPWSLRMAVKSPGLLACHCRVVSEKCLVVRKERTAQVWTEENV